VIGAWGALALAYAIASRLAYVVGVGVALVRQDRSQAFTRRVGVEAGYRRFRRMASVLMNNDAVGLILLSVVTRDTLHLPVGRIVLLAAGGALVVLGGGTKIWAARTLGSEAYHWHNFFAPDDRVPEPSGPYRFLKDPMYTVGYLQAYGLAIGCASWPGLIASAFAQAGIITFHQLVEKPHFSRLVTASNRR
jgi:protein-S-isoprenylcysteine O-methyltransferase Ste14